MILSFKTKQKIISEVKEISKNASSAILASTSGISANKMTELRKEGRKSNVYIRVIRKTLLHLAIKNTCFECLKDNLISSNLIACSIKHPSSAARLFKKFARENENFKIKAAAFEGKIILGSEIDFLASIPTYKESIISLIAIMKEISIGKLICVFIAIRNKKTNG